MASTLGSTTAIFRPPSKYGRNIFASTPLLTGCVNQALRQSAAVIWNRRREDYVDSDGAKDSHGSHSTLGG